MVTEESRVTNTARDTPEDMVDTVDTVDTAQRVMGLVDRADRAGAETIGRRIPDRSRPAGAEGEGAGRECRFECILSAPIFYYLIR